MARVLRQRRRHPVTGPPETWWYSPQCMLLFADSAVEHCANDGTTPPGDMRKAIDEGRAGAIFALGMAGALGVETWMRPVHPRESAPDIRVMYFDGSGPKGSHRMNVLQVEVRHLHAARPGLAWRLPVPDQTRPEEEGVLGEHGHPHLRSARLHPRGDQGRARKGAEQGRTRHVLSGWPAGRRPLRGSAGGSEPQGPAAREPGRCFPDRPGAGGRGQKRDVINHHGF